MSNFRRMLIGGSNPKPAPRLPKEYQEVRWIGCDDRQWINTGIGGNHTAKYDISFKSPVYSMPYHGEYYVFSGHIPGWSYSAGLIPWIYFNEYNQLVLVGDGSFNPFTGKLNDKMNVVFNESGLYLNGELVKSPRTPRTIWGNKPFHIFNGPDHDRPCVMQLHHLKMWSDDALVRDYVPCYIKATGQIGLYDIAELKFYPNEGSGEFLKGPDV